MIRSTHVSPANSSPSQARQLQAFAAMKSPMVAPAPVMLRAQKGLTLIELLVTVAIVAIVSAIAAPAFNNYQDSSNRVMVSNALIDDLDFARKEASNRRANVSMVIDANGSWRIQTPDPNNVSQFLILKDFYNKYDAAISVDGSLGGTIVYTNRGYAQKAYALAVDYGDIVSNYSVTRAGRFKNDSQY